MPEPPKSIPGPTPDAPQVAMARLGAVTGRPDRVSEWIDVHFNPATLQLQVSNELKDTRNNERKQYIAKASAKLTMELQFDTTDTGDDVMQTTRKLQVFVAPPLSQQNHEQIPPPVVLFEWGRIKFMGIAESYKETIDFFSANGVPLRAAVNLTLSRQDQVFDDAPGTAPQDAGPMDDDLALDAPASSAADVANAGESPDAARAVAAANGQENLRFGNGSPLTVSASITLKPPAAFAAAGIGIGGGAGLGIGAGIGIGAGAGIGGSAGIGMGGSAGIGIGASAGIGIGVAASAGAGFSPGAGISGISRLSATEGAFAGLRVTTGGASATARLNTTRLAPPVRSAALSTDRNASFRVGGKATVDGSAGLRADVGGRGSVRGKLSFEGS
jgi:Contractile injection system tube protein